MRGTSRNKSMISGVATLYGRFATSVQASWDSPRVRSSPFQSLVIASARTTLTFTGMCSERYDARR